jgi:ATP-dependent DNA ligase
MPARPQGSRGDGARCGGLRAEQGRAPSCSCNQLSSITTSSRLPSEEPPVGPGWIHEIKHDSFRILVRRAGGRVRLYTRNGYNFADRYPRIVAAMESLPLGKNIGSLLATI